MEKTQETFIGIDVSKAHLDVHGLPSSEAWQADNTSTGLGDWWKSCCFANPP